MTTARCPCELAQKGQISIWHFIIAWCILLLPPDSGIGSTCCWFSNVALFRNPDSANAHGQWGIGAHEPTVVIALHERGHPHIGRDGQPLVMILRSAESHHGSANTLEVADRHDDALL